MATVVFLLGFLHDMDGWIKLHRQFLEWEWYGDIPVKTLFMHCLLKSNSQDVNWKGIIIKRGQFFTSLKHLSDETGLTVKQIRGVLAKLEKTGEMGTQRAHDGTLVTICNYDSYQGIKETKGTPKGNQRAIKGQSKGNKQEREEEIDTNVSILWKQNFEVYKNEGHREFQKYYADKDFILAQEYFFPKSDIKKLIESEWRQYWGTEEAWEYKKKQAIEKINWKNTLVNCIKLHHKTYQK